jgi:hypothetical protein
MVGHRASGSAKFRRFSPPMMRRDPGLDTSLPVPDILIQALSPSLGALASAPPLSASSSSQKQARCRLDERQIKGRVAAVAALTKDGCKLDR